MSPSTELSVDPSNVEQDRAWNGNDGVYWAEHADYFDRSVAAYHEALLAAAAIDGNELTLVVQAPVPKPIPREPL